MPRDHARIKTSRSNDTDWRALGMEAQWTYDALLTLPRLSYCGVVDYLPGRLAALAQGLTDTKVRTAVKRLERARYVVVDHDTAELLLRSYVRHDGVLDRVNMGKAVARALALVTSTKIRDAILTELARLHGQSPGLAGWQGFADLAPDAYAMTQAMASTIPLPIASGDA